MQEEGVKALNLLIKHPLPLLEKPSSASRSALSQHPVTSAVKLGPIHVLRGLVAMKKSDGNNMATQEKTGTIETDCILDSLISNGELDSDEQPPVLSALNIPSSYLDKLGLTLPDDISLTQPHILRVVNHRRSTWESVATPRGGITFCHVDEWGVSLCTEHIHGEKLWLFWPPTPENVALYQKILFESNALPSVSQGIMLFNGLETLFLRTGEQIGWIMPPGTIHAVMTFSKAAYHTGCFLVNFDHFSEAKRCVLQLLDRIKDSPPNQHPPSASDDDAIIENIHEFVLPSWSKLADKLIQHERFQDAREIRQWEDRVREIVYPLVHSRNWMLKRIQPVLTRKRKDVDSIELRRTKARK